jgi:hypothetical protein
MLLTFKPQFEDLIKRKIKLHTIRADKHSRWKVGMMIHFWVGNPRNTRSKLKPYRFGIGRVETIQSVEIYPAKDRLIRNGRTLSQEELQEIAKADGFESWQQMKQFFSKDFFGKIIVWHSFTENGFKK